jgi:hypothetical protein
VTGERIPGDFQQQIQQLQRRQRELEIERDNLKGQVEKLTAQVGHIAPERPGFVLDAFVSSIKSTIESLQAPTEPPPASGVVAILQGMELDIKGFIDVQGDKAHVVLPKPGDPIDANALSTVKISFGTAPLLPHRAAGSG